MTSRIQDAGLFPWLLWFTVFVLTMIVALLIQLVLLPYVFPSWSSGEGLVDNCLDCAGYHRIATGMAAQIRRNGWAAWELRPEGHAPAGLAAALYATTVPRLWTMIPVNAAVHATTVALLFLILRSFGSSSRNATLGAIPFALFPSSALWYAQLLKDGFFFLGFFLFLRGWLSLMQSSRHPSWARSRLVSVAQGLAGGLLLWVIRPEMVRLILTLSIVICSAALCVALASARHRPWRRPLLTGCILTVAVGACVVGVDVLQPAGGQPPTPIIESRQTPATVGPNVPVQRTTGILRTLESVSTRLTAVVIRKRQGYLSEPGAASLDLDVRVETFSELIAYLPRAARNAFLSPFPWDWVGRGTYASTTSLRRVCGLEMVVVYLALACVPFAVWRRRADVFLWVILLHSAAVLVVLGVIVNNWGTLYRLRYGYLMLWVGIGLTGFLQLAAEFRQRRRC